MTVTISETVSEESSLEINPDTYATIIDRADSMREIPKERTQEYSMLYVVASTGRLL